MLGLNAFAENAFASIGQGNYVLVTGNKITVANNAAGVQVLAGATAAVTGEKIAVSQNAAGVIVSIGATVLPAGSAITLYTGAEEVNVLTWNPIDPDADQIWVEIDPL